MGLGGGRGARRGAHGTRAALQGVYRLERHYGLLPSVGAAALGAAALGAVLALPTATPLRIAHPALAVALIATFGAVDWLSWLEGRAKDIAQGMAAVALIAAAVRYRLADARPGLIAGAVLLATTLYPMAMHTATSVEAKRHERWRFAAEGRFASELGRRAEQAAPHTRALPDLYLIILERHPSPRHAAQRGASYDGAALGALRARGWRIQNDAQTGMPLTEATFAAMLALSETLSDGEGGAMRPGSAGLNALFSQGELALSSAFAAPLALDVLARAGYRTEAYVGWWLPTQALRVDAIDHSHRLSGALWMPRTVLLALVEAHGWARRDGKGIDEGSRKRFNLMQQRQCKRFVEQRERLFDKRDREGDAPRLLLYHVYWLHDSLALDSEGSCAEQGTGRVDARRAVPAAYLPHFLERMERHARTYGRGRAFRILAMADEGINDAWSHDAEEAGDSAWRIGSQLKHRAVWRASFAEGLPELWAEEDVPDLPDALKEAIEDAFEAPSRRSRRCS